MLIAKRERLIEWGDCDPARIVFNPRYFEWFDACTANLFTVAGYPKQTLYDRFAVVGWPIVESHAKFLKACHFGDMVTIESEVTDVRRSSFDVAHRLFNAGLLSVEASETRVWAGQHPDDPKGLKGLPIPDEVKSRLLGA
jgi:4-hydroxybenzoyl-CoA thioesterase